MCGFKTVFSNGTLSFSLNNFKGDYTSLNLNITYAIETSFAK